MTHRTTGFGFRLSTTLGLVLLMSGCGVIFGGTTKSLSVASTPSAARLTTEPLTGSSTTPTMISLARKNAYTLVLWKEGYQETQVAIQKKMRIGPLVADILLSGLIGVVVDAVTGGWWDLQPDQVTATLEPLQDGAGLEPILVTVSSSSQRPGPVMVTAPSPVHVRLIQN